MNALCYSATLRIFIASYDGKFRSGGTMHNFSQYVTCSVRTMLRPKRWKVSDHPKQSGHLTLSLPCVQPLYEALKDNRFGTHTYKRQVAVI